MGIASVLTVHNFYQRPGGEDQVFAAEAALLERNGHRVIRYEDRNHRIRSGAASAVAAVWNQGSYQRLQRLAREHRPDVAHFHNTFPLISPAAYYAARRAGVPVVQTLHNYRLLCPGGTFLRDGKACEDCVHGRSLAPAIAHACYRGSHAATAAVAAMLTVHRTLRTWQRMVDVYIAPSEFVRQKFLASGFQEDQIVVKPNTLNPNTPNSDVLVVPTSTSANSPIPPTYALFAGRLSEEKGIQTLSQAWRHLPDIPLLVAGDGPLSDIPWPPNVTLLGPQPHDRILDLMQSASLLVFPSVCYETQGLTILEAYASGLPVIASNLGSASELIDDGRTGLLTRPGDPENLSAKVRWAFEHPQHLAAMRIQARREYEAKYTPERNYKMLVEIYEAAIEHARRRTVLHPAAVHSTS